MARIDFDASQVAPASGSPDAIPKGWYNAYIEESEMKPTKAGNGYQLVLTYVVMDGEYKGRKVWDRLNLDNPSAIAQEIAYKQLSAICHAVGVIKCPETELLHNKPLKIKVKYRAGDDQYDASNEIAAVKNINEVVGTQTAPTAPAAPLSLAPAAPVAPPAAPVAPVASAPPPAWGNTSPVAPPAEPLPPSAKAPAPPVAPPATPPAVPVAQDDTTPPWLRKK